MISSLLHQKEDLIPPHLLNLSLKSLESIQGITLQNTTDTRNSTLHSQDLYNISKNFSLKPIPLKPIKKYVEIVGVDVSTAKIGETETGTIYAFRGSIVWKEKSFYRFIRCGPLVFHLKENSVESYLPNIISSETIHIVSRLRNLFERNLQLIAAKSFKNTLLLLDGSLTAGTPDNPSKHLHEILDASRDRGNTVIAISKSTKLMIDGKNLTTFIQKYHYPCFIHLDEYMDHVFSPHPVHLLGNVLIAKLVGNGFSFRIDIDKESSKASLNVPLGLLLTNESLNLGYPESLRLAHILSIFTESEILAIHGFLRDNYRFRIPLKFNLRRALFGPFGSGDDLIQ
jgi:hypothetical protein